MLDCELLETLYCPPQQQSEQSGRRDRLLYAAVGRVASKTKIHVTIGHATVMADLLFFGVPDGDGEPAEQALEGLTRRIGSLAVKARRCLLLP